MELERRYLQVTRDLMPRGKDGYTPFVMDDVEVVVGPGEGGQVYKIVLQTLGQPHIC